MEVLPEVLVELEPPEPEPLPLRLGLVVGSANRVVEAEFYTQLPSRISLHTARAHLTELTWDALERMLQAHLPQALEDLATVQPHAVVFGCTAAEALRGPQGEGRLARQVEQATGAPCITTLRAVRRRLQRLGARRLWLVTPYVPELAEQVQAWLEAEGLEVVQPVARGLTDPARAGDLRPEAVVQMVYEERLQRFQTGRLPVDATFVAGTHLRAGAVRRRLESVLGVPVVTSAAAALGAALELLEPLAAGGAP